MDAIIATATSTVDAIAFDVTAAAAAATAIFHIVVAGYCCCYVQFSQLVCFICKVFLSSSCTKMSWGAVFSCTSSTHTHTTNDNGTFCVCHSLIVCQFHTKKNPKKRTKERKKEKMPNKTREKFQSKNENGFDSIRCVCEYTAMALKMSINNNIIRICRMIL